MSSEIRKAQARASWHRNKHKYTANKKLWKKTNKNKENEYRRAAYRRDPETHKKRSKQYAKMHPEIYRSASAKRRTKITRAGGAFTPKEFKDLCIKHNNLCLCCGKKKKLTADHVLPVELGGSSNIENIQPLCKSCNSKKHTRTTDFRKRPQCLLPQST